MQMNESRALLLAGVVMFSAVSSVQVAHSAEATQKLRVNVCDAIEDRGVLPSFMKVDWEEIDGRMTLKKIEFENPEEQTELTLVVEAKGDHQFAIAEGVFGDIAFEKLILNIVIGTHDTASIYLPGRCTSLFEGSSSINSVEFGNVNVSEVSSMERMFCGCYRVSEIDLRVFKESRAKADDLTEIFRGCESLEKVDLFLENEEELYASLILRMFDNDYKQKLITEEDSVKQKSGQEPLLDPQEIKQIGEYRAAKRLVRQLGITGVNIDTSDDEDKYDDDLRKKDGDINLENKIETGPQKVELPTMINEPGNNNLHKEIAGTAPKEEGIDEINKESSEKQTNNITDTQKIEYQKIAIKAERRWYTPIVNFFVKAKNEVTSWASGIKGWFKKKLNRK